MKATTTSLSNELHEALSLANHYLDKPYADPDDDLSVVSRHLIRQHEIAERYKQALTRANGFLIMHNLEPVKLEYPPGSAGNTSGSDDR